jgi:hypothetical protein
MSCTACRAMGAQFMHHPEGNCCHRAQLVSQNRTAERPGSNPNTTSTSTSWPCRPSVSRSAMFTTLRRKEAYSDRSMISWARKPDRRTRPRYWCGPQQTRSIRRRSSLHTNIEGTWCRCCSSGPGASTAFRSAQFRSPERGRVVVAQGLLGRVRCRRRGWGRVRREVGVLVRWEATSSSGRRG